MENKIKTYRFKIFKKDESKTIDIYAYNLKQAKELLDEYLEIERYDTVYDYTMIRKYKLIESLALKYKDVIYEQQQALEKLRLRKKLFKDCYYDEVNDYDE